MTWRIHLEKIGFIEETLMPRFKEYLTNNDGVSIELKSARRNAGEVSLRYTSKVADIDDVLVIRQSQLDGDAAGVVLGPVCNVAIRRSSLSKDVSIEEGQQIAADIESALREFKGISLVRAPFPEKIVFLNSAVSALKLGVDN